MNSEIDKHPKTEWDILYQKELALLEGMRQTLQAGPGTDWKLSFEEAVRAYESLLVSTIKMNKVADRQHARLVDTQVKLKTTNEALEVASAVDQLTGLLNRHKTDAILRAERTRFDRGEGPASLILIDIDRFKPINDTHGHNVGDLVLAQFAAIARRRVRSRDYCCRWGGDEFLVILPDTTGSQALVVAEGLRTAVEESRFPVSPVTVSLGVAELAPDMKTEDWIALADRHLYLAKRSGRNQTCPSLAEEEADAGHPRVL